MRGLTVSCRLFDFGLKDLFSREVQVDAEPDSARPVLAIPPIPASPSAATYFLKLSVRDSAGTEISSNFYWLPAQPSIMAWDKTPDTAFTPIARFEDLSALNALPRVRLEATATAAGAPGEASLRVTVRNPGSGLAFQVHLGICDARSGEELLPVFWEDNYISLLPGESRTLQVQHPSGRAVKLSVTGWNVEPLDVTPETATRP